nr:efflux RND transporter permease subunit [Candidatus Sumerlaeota bacterium]
MVLSHASIKRPVAMTCLIIALTFLGVNSFRKMGLELMPKMDIPYITIVTVYPGASPVDIEVDVAKRIEDAVSSIDGIKHVASLCMENVAQTIIEFDIGIDVNVAANDVREKIDKIISDFPSDVEKPVIMKFDINALPIVTLALTGDVSIEELYDYADNNLRDKLSVLAGVANVELIGGSERE